MDIDIDYKKGVLFIRIIGYFIRSNISRFEEKVIPIILELTAKKVSINLSNIVMIDNYGLESFIKISNIVNRFDGRVAICDINNEIKKFMKRSDVFDYCFSSRNEKSVLGVLNIWVI